MVLLLVPMLLLVLSTQHFFDRQIQENERNYLQVAMKTVRNDMENRMDEMRKAGLLFAGDSDINKAMYDDRNRLAMALNNLKRNFNYLDYVVIVDRENHILASSSPYRYIQMTVLLKSWLPAACCLGKRMYQKKLSGLKNCLLKIHLNMTIFRSKYLTSFRGRRSICIKL